jgi:hypothetical protein
MGWAIVEQALLQPLAGDRYGMSRLGQSEVARQTIRFELCYCSAPTQRALLPEMHPLPAIRAHHQNDALFQARRHLALNR